MLIDAQYRKCVVFLFADVPDERTGIVNRTPAGSAFLVGIPVGGDRFVRYLVTARHVVSRSRQYGSLFARVHLADGSATFAEFTPAAWYEHPTTEVAVALLYLSVEIDHVVVSVDQFETDARLIEHVVGVGDDVFFVGLFSEHPGLERNQPIVRFGTIALMPDEKILVDIGDSTARIRAYLVEARSWGGHSGSPAFVYFPPDRFGDRIQVLSYLPIFLLGLVQGHFNIPSDVKFIGDIGEQGSGRVPVNAGIAAVVPAQDIYDLLMSDPVVEQRDKLLKQMRSLGR